MDGRQTLSADAITAPPPEAAAPAERRGALHATLGMASSAASMVLYPYVAAGKVAYQATSYAVHAPIKITRHVKDSILGGTGEENKSEQSDDAAYDLFGERSSAAGDSGEERVAVGDDEEEDLFGEQYPTTIIDAEEGASNVDSNTSSGVVSQLLFLPVRLVSSGVSTAVAIPGSLISYSGKKISGAVSTSQSLATTALVVSSGAVARTSLNVAQGLTYGAFSTASFTVTKFSGVVNTSVRTVGYAIPTSVSNAVWQGMGATGNASVSVVSYAIAVPAYRMLDALIPDLSKYFSERDCVEKTREVVLMLVKLLGPQNALYLLKFVYETVNSDEAHDMFLLCHDIVCESLDRENYRQVGSSIGASTGVSTLVPVVKEIYNLIPSVDELFDAFAFVADVSEEVFNGLVSPPSSSSNNSFEEEEWRTSSRFEYIDGDDDNISSDDGCKEHDTAAEDSESGHSTISTDAFELRHESDVEFDDDYNQDAGEEQYQPESMEADAVYIGDGFGESGSWSSSATSSSTSSSTSSTTSSTSSSNSDHHQYTNGQPQQTSSANSGGVLDAGVSFLSKVCDSDEAASLFNTFGDFLDVLLVD